MGILVPFELKNCTFTFSLTDQNNNPVHLNGAFEMVFSLSN